MIETNSVPYFVATNNSSASNVTGDGTVYQCVFNTLTQGISAWYNTSTGVFTAKIPGNYFFSAFVDANNTTSQTNMVCSLVTTGKTYVLCEFNPGAIRAPANTCMGQGSVMGVNMNLNDTAYISFQCSGSTKTVAFNTSSNFTGRRIS